MVKRYVFVRMPTEIYEKYKAVKFKMETDLHKVTGKNMTLSMPKVFNTIISPEFNRNYIEVDLFKLAQLAKKRKGYYDLFKPK